MSGNNGTTDYFSPRPTCDGCERPILGGIYRRGPERLCRPCYAPAPSTTRILGCQVVRFEKAPCEPATTPPPPTVPATPTPKAAAQVAAPVAAPTRPVRRGKKAPRAKPLPPLTTVSLRPWLRKGEKSPDNATFCAQVRSAVATRGWFPRSEILDLQPSERRQACNTQISRLATAGEFARSGHWIGPIGTPAPPEAEPFEGRVLATLRVRPHSRRELLETMPNADTVLTGLRRAGLVESVGGLWRLKGRH